MSLSIQHSEPIQKHLHLSNDYQSNRLNWAKHQHRVNPQIPHHHAIGYIVPWAKISEFSNFHTISLNIKRLPIVAHSERKIQYSITLHLFFSASLCKLNE